MVKHLPTMWETQVQSLGWEALLEKEMATHSSILAWKIPWMEEPGVTKSRIQLSDFTFKACDFHFCLFYLLRYLSSECFCLQKPSHSYFSTFVLS